MKDDLRADAKLGEHVDQRVDAEEADLATHQVAHPRLRHAQELGCFALCQPTRLDLLLETEHEVRPDFQMLGLIAREPEVSEHVSRGPRHFRLLHPAPILSAVPGDSSTHGDAAWPARRLPGPSVESASRTRGVRTRPPRTSRGTVRGARHPYESESPEYPDRHPAWLSIVGFQAWLAPPELEPGYLPNLWREAPDLVSDVAEPHDGLEGHGVLYKDLYGRGNLKPSHDPASGRWSVAAPDAG
jgi:hypothetical protein